MKISKKKIVCALTVLLAIFFVACSDDSGSGMGAGFTSEEDDPSSYVAEKIVSIKNKTISGYAQKGPFRAGSIVTIYELELDGETFAQTGKSFTGKVANDKGEFKIPNVSLKSQYALLQVTGYFTSEINGEGVRATLTAVTDLSKRENVNVNILTHLEYDRVLALLGKGMNFTSAKKQAGREVLAAFGIGLEENSVAEDLDVSGESDADAALVAISKLVLAGEKEGTNRDEEDLSGLLVRIAGSIGENGDWVDVSGHYVPSFEGGWPPGAGYYLYFSFGNGFFREHLKEGDYNSINKWNMAWRVSNNGNGWNGRECSVSFNSADEKYIYQFYLSWGYIGQFCTSSLEGKIVDVETSNPYQNTYLCKDGEWRFVAEARPQSDSENSVFKKQWCENFMEEESSSFGVGKDGEIRKGGMTGLNYKYDEKENRWLEVNAMDTLLPIVCTSKYEGEFAKDNDSAYYYCGRHRRLSDLSHCEYATFLYVGADECSDEHYWRKMTDVEMDILEICTTDKDGKIRKKKTGESYKCDGERGWLNISKLDTLFPTVCTLKHRNEVAKINDSIYVCRSDGWRFTWDGAYGTLEDNRDGKIYKTVKIGSQTWMAENLNYADSVKSTWLKGNSWCGNLDSCEIYGRFYSWSWELIEENVCPDGWHLPTSQEFDTLLYFVGDLGEECWLSTAVDALRSTSNSWSDGGGLDAYGFSAFPVRVETSSLSTDELWYDNIENFSYRGSKAIFWIVHDGPTYAYAVRFDINDSVGCCNRGDFFSDIPKAGSVRCIKD